MHALLRNNNVTIILNLSSSFKKSIVDKIWDIVTLNLVINDYKFGLSWSNLPKVCDFDLVDLVILSNRRERAKSETDDTHIWYFWGSLPPPTYKVKSFSPDALNH